MPKQTTIKPYLEVKELETRYRQATDPVERSQRQIIWLLAQNRKVPEVAEVTGYSASWIRELARRYNRRGEEALGDKRHQAAGKPPLLSAELQQTLAEDLQQPPPEGGLWTGPKVSQWIEAKTGRKVRRQRGWEYLLKMGLTLQQPRPQHAKADREAQAEFKKTPRAGRSRPSRPS
jgi:transposase